MPTSFIKLVHEGKVHTVALSQGIETEELNKLLKTVFSINGEIVGLLGEKGLIIPMSLVCKSPEVVPTTLCKILVEEIKKVDVPPSVDAALIEEDEEATADYVSREILRFIDQLKKKSMLDASQANLLEELLVENSTLLFAAYSVAVSANDSQYLAVICKDLAKSLESPQGRQACEAQDEVLQVSDQLYIGRNITENQLLYLRHLVLTRDEAVATLYDSFQEHQNLRMLAKDLYELSNTHPYQQLKSDKREAPTNDESFDESNNDEEDYEAQKYTSSKIPEPHHASPKSKRSAQVAKSLTGVVSLMIRTKKLSNMEASVLMEMIALENDYVMASYDLYEVDEDLNELQDTLLRCAKLEIRKRVAASKESVLTSQEKEFLNEEGQQEDEDEEDDNEDDENDDEDAEGEEDEEEKVDGSPSKEFSFEDINVESILIPLGVKNIWSETVPERFIKSVFIAVIRKELSIDHGKALCDLFENKYDMVHAAWEVYTVQNDEADFVDTLRRIVRGLQPLEKKPEAKTASSSSTADSNAKPSSKASGGDDVDEAKKVDAIAAVQAAKKELLKHSLEMMVKQGLTSAESASSLYSRFLLDDTMIEAAIDSYAADRNVMEFLDTLQILANHSVEDLQKMMKQQASEERSKSSMGTTSNAGSKVGAMGVGPDGKPYSDVQIQLRSIIAELSRNDMVEDKLALQLVELVDEEDYRLLAAYESYEETKKGAELIDAMLRVGRQELKNQQEGNDDDENDEENDEEEEEEDYEDGEAEEDEAAKSLLKTEDQRTIVEILTKSKTISPSQASKLVDLINKENGDIQRIFSRYEIDKDVHGLIDSLKDLEELTQNSTAGTSAGSVQDSYASSYAKSSDAVYGGDSVDDDDDDDDEENDDGEEGEELDEDDKAAIDKKFFSIIQNMNLSNLETAALRVAIAKNDPSIRASIESYRITRNENNLVADLRAISQKTIEDTYLDKGYKYDYEEDADDDEADDAEEEKLAENQVKEEADRIRAAARSKGYNIVSEDAEVDLEEEEDDADDEGDEDEDGEEDDDDDDDDDEGDDDEEDDYDNNDDGNNDPADDLITSQSARDHVFPILIAELVKESILTNSEGSKIMKHFAEGNEVIKASLDLYDKNNDMAQLVDNLQKTVQTFSS